MLLGRDLPVHARFFRELCQTGAHESSIALMLEQFSRRCKLNVSIASIQSFSDERLVSKQASVKIGVLKCTAGKLPSKEKQSVRQTSYRLIARKVRAFRLSHAATDGFFSFREEALFLFSPGKTKSRLLAILAYRLETRNAWATFPCRYESLE